MCEARPIVKKCGKGFEFDSARDEGKTPRVEQREISIEDDLSIIHILDTKKGKIAHKDVNWEE